MNLTAAIERQRRDLYPPGASEASPQEKGFPFPERAEGPFYEGGHHFDRAGFQPLTRRQHRFLGRCSRLRWDAPLALVSNTVKKMDFLPHPLPRVKRPSRAFILLEVLVSLAIMGIALSMVMESFTTSMKGARNASAVTMASVLARDLIEQWELTPPEEEEKTGDFGKDHPGYTYKVRYDKVELDYDDVDPPEEGRLEYLRRITLDVYYQSSNAKSTPKRMLHVETALTSGERFSEQSRKFNKIRFDR
jgi:type II secretory pathway pseudopilin PulG